jgi:hypothetical protein
MQLPSALKIVAELRYPRRALAIRKQIGLSRQLDCVNLQIVLRCPILEHRCASPRREGRASSGA